MKFDSLNQIALKLKLNKNKILHFVKPLKESQDYVSDTANIFIGVP